MQSVSGFDFFPLNIDENGKLTNSAELDSLKGRADTATDLIIFGHGFRNSVDDASQLYFTFLKSFRAHFARPEFAGFANRDFIAAGVYWPSKALPESFGTAEGSVQSADDGAPFKAALAAKLEDLKTVCPTHSGQLDRAIELLANIEDDGTAQNQFTELVLSLTDGSQLDITEGLPKIRSQEGTVILQKLSAPIILSPAPADSSDDGGVESIDDPGFADAGGGAQSVGSMFGSILNGVEKFLNGTTWWVMKNRAGVVGANGVAQVVRALKAAKPGLRIHLVGHSLGGRMMAACANSLAQDPLVQPDSVTLLEAAFSHYGFSANNGDGVAGFFRDVIAKNVVKGPFLATFSAQDEAVGADYALASRVADDNVKAVGDANDPFGGIGRNGAQKTTESQFLKLQPAGTPYQPFKLGIVNCLDGSGGLIKNHGDVTNSDVTYVFSCSVAATQPAAAVQGGAT